MEGDCPHSGAVAEATPEPVLAEPATAATEANESEPEAPTGRRSPPIAEAPLAELQIQRLRIPAALPSEAAEGTEAPIPYRPSYPILSVHAVRTLESQRLALPVLE